jgi:hypothetical protein
LPREGQLRSLVVPCAVAVAVLLVIVAAIDWRALFFLLKLVRLLIPIGFLFVVVVLWLRKQPLICTACGEQVN